jgi:hypothetical protein
MESPTEPRFNTFLAINRAAEMLQRSKQHSAKLTTESEFLGHDDHEPISELVASLVQRRLFEQNARFLLSRDIRARSKEESFEAL